MITQGMLLSFISTVKQFGFILLAVFILLLMVTIHELGHYTAGKLLKFKINEFSVGFGKVLFQKKKKSGELVSLRLIPLGGYCAFDGEEDVKDESSFNSQKPWKRIIVLLSGVLFNFISAIIFSIFLLGIIGNGTQIVTATNENQTVLQANDIIVSVNGEKPSYFNGGIAGITSDIKDKININVVVLRDGKQEELMVQKYAVLEMGETTYKLGISTGLVKMSWGEAILQATPFTFEMAGECFKIFGELITGKISLSQLGGPIATISTIATNTSANILNLLLLLPLIAVNLAVFNILPIPALDGARIVFVLIEWIRGKAINRELEAKIHAIGLMLLFAFVILVDFMFIF